MRLRLVIAYVGTGYMGWQVQAQHLAMQTIQGQLEHALQLLAGQEVRVHGSGRTDSGVHAERQVAHCDFPEDRYARLKDMRNSLNALLPCDIRVFAVQPCERNFHARFDAHNKTYRYRFWQERGFVPPALKPYVWCCGPLDVAVVREALPHLLGEHDFACLANAGTTGRESTVRTLYALELNENTVWEGCAPMLELFVTGSGFLKQMVRNMAGLLAEIGRGKVGSSDVPRILESRSRTALPAPTAPASGLTLMCVEYGKGHGKA
ncbi:MAG: tRNA pseudouridine(38-40) synthase TruA [Candidatus Desulfovibrio faecigallinarum]|uniref:tRNA pseudouridine(38-40) synthase TruA n=1 Tax=Desulfovibrio sp. An276 TaxID=1965618 RepID=UPI000B37B8AF|nr:tRNA pseudouridine(38-40) synthase TruA [Desulfovibrio sp. An276]MBU3832322.1 tRNA pseudouridine(38-40) synthase TruA [Candidatus Desulfovibrio faecigallinarum]OUO55323.1 tRNA pseudouridine(38-40) synthase TruA [Desulfovibrio sp. An276]